MRILDAKSDFYDYYQNIYYDPTFVYDRRDSYVLTRDDLLSLVNNRWHGRYDDGIHYFLLQVGHTFWLLRMKITKKRASLYLDYQFELMDKWKDYQVKKVPILLQYIDFSYFVEDDKQRIAAAKRHEYKSLYKSDHHIEYQTFKQGYKKFVRTIPILKDTGLTAILDAQEVFLALEEYVMLLKTDAEKTEPDGLTNDMKIEMHGFDTKNSFRGK